MESTAILGLRLNFLGPCGDMGIWYNVGSAWPHGACKPGRKVSHGHNYDSKGGREEVS